MVRGPFLQDTTEGEFVLELEVLRAEEESAICLCVWNVIYWLCIRIMIGGQLPEKCGNGLLIGGMKHGIIIQPLFRNT